MDPSRISLNTSQTLPLSLSLPGKYFRLIQMEDSLSAKGCNRYLPEDVVRSILLRLPVKCLLRFRCVCRTWNSLIRNPSFVSDHLIPSNPQNNRGIIFLNGRRSAFHLLSAGRTEQLDFPFSEGLGMIGHCDGILCVFSANWYFLWNPATRQFKPLPQSCLPQRDLLVSTAEFGFDSNRNDYIVLRHVCYYKGQFRSHRAELYSLKTDSWREIQSPLPDSVMLRSSCCCTIDGAIFWPAYDSRYDHTVVALFEIASNAFRIIMPPAAFVGEGRPTVLNGSLAYINIIEDENYCEPTGNVLVWVMKDFRGVGSWVKHFSFAPPLPWSFPYGFLDTGELLFWNGNRELTSFCPITQKITNHEVEPDFCKFVSYTESLVPIQGEMN